MDPSPLVYITMHLPASSSFSSTSSSSLVATTDFFEFSLTEEVLDALLSLCCWLVLMLDLLFVTDRFSSTLIFLSNVFAMLPVVDAPLVFNLLSFDFCVVSFSLFYE
jgi:hypothetical protein